MVNPKALVGRSKPRVSAIPPSFILALGKVMQTGANKYGRFNWRDKPIDAKDYIDAIYRHFLSWQGGEDIDPDSHVHHLIHLAACCCVIVDAIEHDAFNDDRQTIGEPKDD